MNNVKATKGHSVLHFSKKQKSLYQSSTQSWWIIKQDFFYFNSYKQNRHHKGTVEYSKQQKNIETHTELIRQYRCVSV